MKRSSRFLFAFLIFALIVPSAVFAQTGGPSGEPTSLCPGGLLGTPTEADFTTIIDDIGFGPAGGNRVGVVCSPRFVTLTINAQDSLDVACESVVAYQMNSVGQLHKVDSTCVDGVLNLPVSANTHFFLYSFGRPTGAQDLVELSVEV
jgi:hypothetical protein